MNNRLARLAALATVSGTLAACGSGGGSGGDYGYGQPPPPSSFFTASTGVAQKGPFVTGSSISVEEIEANLFSPTGRESDYETTSDLGTFTPNTVQFPTQYAYLEAKGNYFDEVTNSVSDGQITLSALSDLAATSVLNINVLTSLSYPRMQYLVSGPPLMKFAAAQAQAQSEVLAAFSIQHGSTYGNFGSLDISKAADGDQILLAVSSLLVNGNSSDSLNPLLAHMQSDIRANGAITSATTQAFLLASAKSLKPASVAANINQRYASFGLNIAASDISDWIDQDGDGVVGKFKFQVAHATPSSAFTFPLAVTDPYAGTSISVSAGGLSVNGTTTAGAVTLNAGDVVSVSPAGAGLPNGVLIMYLQSGTVRAARVTFLSGS